jgi:hypothetical protein
LPALGDLPRSVGLEPADLTVPGAQDRGEQLAVLVDDPQGGVTEFDGDGLAGVGEADLDALAGDLDSSAAGYPPLDGQAGGRERLRAGIARQAQTNGCRAPVDALRIDVR